MLAHTRTLPTAGPRHAAAAGRRPAVAALAAAVPATAVAPLVTARADLPAGIRGVEFFGPELASDPGKLLAAKVPFLTTQAGALPAQPRSLDHALYMYGEYTSQYVSVRVDNSHVKLRSWDHAVSTLRAAQEGGSSYWCSLLEAVRHPAWWPSDAEKHVPNYDQVIFGRGNASIGLHFDKDNACAGGSRTPVSTYLAICSGRKLVLLLPPGQKLLPAGGDAGMLLAPTPEFLEKVRAAGGHFFLLEDVGAGGSGAGSSGPSGSSASGASSGGGISGGGASSGGGAFSATALFMPAGWWHWVVGLTDWHVVYGGSFYPDEPVQP